MPEPEFAWIPLENQGQEESSWNSPIKTNGSAVQMFERARRLANFADETLEMPAATPRAMWPLKGTVVGTVLWRGSVDAAAQPRYVAQVVQFGGPDIRAVVSPLLRYQRVTYPKVRRSAETKCRRCVFPIQVPISGCSERLDQTNVFTLHSQRFDSVRPPACLEWMFAQKVATYGHVHTERKFVAGNDVLYWARIENRVGALHPRQMAANRQRGELFPASVYASSSSPRLRPRLRCCGILGQPLGIYQDVIVGPDDQIAGRLLNGQVTSECLARDRLEAGGAAAGDGVLRERHLCHRCIRCRQPATPSRCQPGCEAAACWPAFSASKWARLYVQTTTVKRMDSPSDQLGGNHRPHCWRGHYTSDIASSRVRPSEHRLAIRNWAK